MAVVNKQRVAARPASSLLGLSASHWTLLALAGIVLLGLGLRLFRLVEVPYGFHPDEGHNATDALAIIDGWRPAFLPRDNGREPLFSYLMAVTISLFGPTVWAARLVGALGGTLVIIAQFLFVRSLPLPRPRLAALLSAALVAVTFWPVSLSHQAIRSGLFPLWITLLLWTWWRALRGDDGRQTTDDGPSRSFVHRPSSVVAWSVLAGVFLAAALYTHMMARLILPALALSALWPLLRERRRAPLVGLVVMFGVATVLLVPMLLYFLQEPGMFTYRAGQISVLNAKVNGGDLVRTLVDQAVKIALAFNVRGSTAWVENLPGRPVFDPLLSVFFLAGLALLAWDLVGKRGRVPQTAAILMVLTVPTMLAPSWLSDGAPSFGRMTGSWPVVFLLPAWALALAATWLDRRARPVGLLLAVGVVALSGAWSMTDFFGRYGNEPRTYETFRSSSIGRAIHVNDLAKEGPTYIDSVIWNQAVMRYLTSASTLGVYGLMNGLVLPPEGDVRYAFDSVQQEDADKFAQRWPMMQRDDLVDRFDHVVLIAFRLPRDKFPLLQEAGPAPHPSFADQIQLEAHRLGAPSVSPGKSLTLTLQWRALAATDLDHNFFVHVVTPDGRGLGQYDGAPLGGSYGTHLWQPGERILQTVTIPIAKNAPPGPAIVRVGWYDWRTGERLAVASDNDAAIDIDRVEVQQ